MARSRSFLQQIPPRFATSSALPTRDAQGEPLIRLQTLGAATILVGEMRLSAAADTLFALLLRIAYAPGLMLGRDQLVAALWPDQAQARQRANLRQSLYKLRSHGVRIAMVGDVVQLDATQLITTFALDRSFATFERDVTHGTEPFGVFLPGFTVRWLEYQEWVLQLREVVHADVRRVLVEQLRMRRERADWGGADALARWLLQFDPLNEEATLTVAECTALSGSKKEALAIIDRYLEELGPLAGDLRLPATMLRRRISDMGARTRALVSPTERYFVGREAEMAELTLAMRRAKWRDGSAVLVHGPSGIGKSRLVRELEKVAGIEGISVVHAACRESESARPMSAFLDLLPQLASMPGALGCAPESMRALSSIFPLHRAASNSGNEYVPERGVVDVESERTTPLSDSEEDVRELSASSSVRNAIVDLLCAVSDEHALILVVEDVHWMDDSSWDSLSDLIERLDAMRVFVLLNGRLPHARPVPPERSPRRLVARQLAPLDESSLLELSQAIGEDLAAAVPSELARWFAQASEGVPLFLHALVVHYVDTGEAGGVPPTLRGVINQRLERLDELSMLVLQCCALLGRYSTAERTQVALELRASEMLSALSALESLSMIAVRADDAIQAHDLIATVGLERLTPIVSRTLHSKIGQLLLAQGRASSDPELVLAGLEHLAGTFESERLLNETLASQGVLLDSAVPMAALAAIKRVEAKALPETDRLALERTAARLHILAGQYADASAQPAGLSFAFRPATLLTEAEADRLISLADAALRIDPEVDRQRIAQQLVEIAEQAAFAPSTRLRAADTVLSAISNDDSRDLALRIGNALDVMSVASQFRADYERVSIMYHTIFGSRTQGLVLAGRLLARSEGIRPSPASHRDALRAGVAQRVLGESDDHLVALERAFTIASDCNIPMQSLNAAFHLAHCCLDLGDLALASKWAAEVRRIYEQMPEKFASTFVHSVFCRMALLDSDLAEARHQLGLIKSTALRFASVRSRIYNLAQELEYGLLASNEPPEEAMVKSLLEWRPQISRNGTCDYAHAVLIRALCRMNKPSEAKALADSYLRLERRETRVPSASLRDALRSIGVTTPQPF